MGRGAEWRLEAELSTVTGTFDAVEARIEPEDLDAPGGIPRRYSAGVDACGDLVESIDETYPSDFV